jgi:hypothetical protein
MVQGQGYAGYEFKGAQNVHDSTGEREVFDETIKFDVVLMLM